MIEKTKNESPKIIRPKRAYSSKVAENPVVNTDRRQPIGLATTANEGKSTRPSENGIFSPDGMHTFGENETNGFGHNQPQENKSMTVKKTKNIGEDVLAVSIKDAARLLSISHSTVRRMIKNGTIREVKIGDSRIPMSEIHRLLEGESKVSDAAA